MTKFEFPPRSSRGAVLGFTWSQIAMVVAGLISAVVGLNLLVISKPAAAGMFALGLLLVTFGLLRIKGRRITEWTPVVIAALIQRRTRQHRRRAPGAARPGCRLPVAARGRGGRHHRDRSAAPPQGEDGDRGAAVLRHQPDPGRQ
jgi:hypothetical protein